MYINVLLNIYLVSAIGCIAIGQQILVYVIIIVGRYVCSGVFCE